ncbi:MAG: histidinol-phosphatase HisJ family protein [Lachnospiraceae bacterium]|nr:histidinol-phosphatase HisJ family protein [Lachnospiraceae bacterium]
MYLTDFHLHSKYSFDGKEELRTICDQAIAQGMQEIAITDHMDIYSGKPYTCILDAKSLYQELREVKESYRGRLKVMVGAEVGQPQINPEEAEKFMAEYPLDFVIGSVHNVENDADLYYFDFAKMDCNKIYDHYLDWLLELADGYDFDVMGHITYPIRYMLQRGQKVDMKLFDEKIRDLYQRLISNGKGIELNVSGLYRPGKFAMPTLELLKLYKECGGEILTIGSDAHEKQYVGAPIREGMEIVKAAGFTHINTFSERKPVFHTI